MSDDTKPVAVRSTVNIEGMPRGRVALVDPSDPYIALLLKRGRLVREDERHADAE